jgi:hypothetical protein
MTHEENLAQAELEKAAFMAERIGLMLSDDDELSVEDATTAAETEWDKIRAFFGGGAA